MIALLVCCLIGANESATIASRLEHPPLLRGQFTQEKHLAGFKHPVVSRGHFLLAQDRGILWDTDAPFPSHVTITRERILSSRSDGSTAMQLDSSHAPLFAVNEILFALLAGDVDVLQRRFAIRGQDGPTWQLDLQASDPGVAKAVQSVQLRGGRYVENVELHEASGDSTTLHLEHIATTPPLSRDESKRLE